MADENNFKRCEPNDPKRCQASGQMGQCPYLSVEGVKYCPRHNASARTISAKRASDMYSLGKYQEIVEGFAVHDEIKNLRAEIGILRMTLQAIINQCGGESKQLVAYSGKIADMSMKLKDLLRTCHQIDKDMGLLLDRDKVMLIGQKIVDLISLYVTDPAVVDTLSNQIANVILEVSVSNQETI